MSSRIIFHVFCTDADDVSTRTNDVGAIGGLNIFVSLKLLLLSVSTGMFCFLRMLLYNTRNMSNFKHLHLNLN